MDLNNKTVIVTGSGSGIGRAIAIEFAKVNCNVVCVARRMDAINETVEMIKSNGGSAIAVKADITNEGDLDNVVNITLKEYKQIDILINNAGSFNTIGAIWEVESKSWWQDVTINLLGTMLTTKTVLKEMMKKDSGIIINMNGGGALGPLPGGSGYGVSKAAVLRLTDTLAGELKTINSNIITFAIGPGLVRTEMTELQANTPMGQKWLAGTGECFETGDYLREPYEVGQKMIELSQIASTDLSGRIFDVDTNVEEILNNLKEIKEKDKYTMRFNV